MSIDYVIDEERVSGTIVPQNHLALSHPRRSSVAAALA
jgi:hypothetical protein